MFEGNRRPLIFGGVALAVVIVLIGGILLLRGGSETKLTVQSIPNDLTLTLDGHQIPANGEVKIKSGQHTLVGSRRGFESYTTTITAGSDPVSYQMYLYANGAEGREWAHQNPEQEYELEARAGRNFDEMQERLRARYPIIAFLPYIGDGFEATRTASKTDPKNPNAISIVIEVYGPTGKQKAMQWIQSNGWDLDSLDMIWTTGK
jgi:hypothetical protein